MSSSATHGSSSSSRASSTDFAGSPPEALPSLAETLSARATKSRLAVATSNHHQLWPCSTSLAALELTAMLAPPAWAWAFRRLLAAERCWEASCSAKHLEAERQDTRSLVASGRSSWSATPGASAARQLMVAVSASARQASSASASVDTAARARLAPWLSRTLGCLPLAHSKTLMKRALSSSSSRRSAYWVKVAAASRCNC
mmetsp:Transcript_50250/g.90271  ORF Transcript_50250/g.90271 Transcript_50250/m.90271 type:complete len:201 (-) Transcript_50250:6540-7142(-)